MLVTLGKAGIKTLDDLADLATDELIAKKRQEQRRRENAPPRRDGPPRRDSNRTEDKGGVLGEYGLSEEQGNEIIMAARAHWFDDEPAADSSSGEAADADSSQ
jgi:N utilization substance protein A